MATSPGKHAFPKQRLAAALPDHIGEWRRTSLGTPVPSSEYEADPAMQASYARAAQRAKAEVVDLGAAGVAAAKMPMPAGSASRQTDSGTERAYTSKGRLVREELERDGGMGSTSVALGNGLSVRISGKGLDGPTLQALIDGVDLGALEALKRSAR